MIVALSADYLDTVTQIETEDGDVRWSRAQFEKEASSQPVRLFVLFSPSPPLPVPPSLVGYGGYWKAADEAQITNLVIRRPARRQGFGRKLLDHMIQKATEEGCVRCTLEVRSRNTAARQLYGTMGFREVGKRVSLYKDPVDDAILMEKTL